jgi:TP901 family phage tail tape measure protein
MATKRDIEMVISAKDEASRAINSLVKSLQELARAQTETGESARLSQKELKEAAGAIGELMRVAKGDGVKRLQKQFADFARSTDRLGKSLVHQGHPLSLYLTGPIVAGLGLAVKTATEFESAMADVRKVVDFPTPDSFRQMGEDIRALSLRLPVAAKDLAAIAAAAGQAGIGAGELTRFTELVAKASIAFELSAEDAGSALAKIKTALGLSIPDVERLADAMNQLANNMAASETDVLDVVNRVAALGGVAGVASKDIAAIGVAMVSTGVDSERAATALRNVLLVMQSGTTATKSQQEAWARLGLDSVTVAKRIQREGVGVLLDVFERIRRQAPEVRAAITQALFDKRAVDAVVPLIANLNVLRDTLGLVADETAYLGSTQREFEVRAETAANNFQLLKNSVDNLRISIGDKLLPAFTSLSTSLAKAVNSLSEGESTFLSWGIAGAAAAAAVGPFLLVIGQTVRSVASLARGLRLVLPLLAGLAGIPVAGIAAVGAAVAALSFGISTLRNRQLDAQAGAAAHSEALAQLDTIVGQVKKGVPGAADAFDRLSRAQRRNIEASLAQARAMLESLRATALSDAISHFGDIDDPDIRNAWINADERVRSQMRLVETLEAQLADLSKRQAEVGRAAEQSGADVAAAGEVVVRQTEHTIEVIRGGRREIVALGTDAQGAGATAAEGMAIAGQAVEDAVRIIRGGRAEVSGMGADAQAAAQAIGEGLSVAGQAIGETVNIIRGGRSEITQFHNSIADAANTLTSGVADATGETFGAVVRRIGTEFDGLEGDVRRVVRNMRAELQSLKTALDSARSAADGAPGHAEGGFAGGGQVSGPGTSISDSILAWLSNGEYVVKAAAVRKYGAEFFDALNNLKLPKDLFNRGFRLGGPIRMPSMQPIPTFAAGGIVQASKPMIPVNLHIGGNVFQVMSDEAVVGSLVRELRKDQISSGGPAPSWVR